jgi:putative transposase
MLRVADLSISGYHDWLKRTPSKRALARTSLITQVKTLHSEHHGVYGQRRMRHLLQAQGMSVSRRYMGKIMRAAGVRGVCKRSRWLPKTTDSDHALPIANNHLDRKFSPAAVQHAGRVWTGDITYIHTREGWVYLAVVIDLATRQIVGYHMAEHMRTELIRLAFVNAVNQHRPQSSLLFHSDRGSQYASGEFVALLLSLNVKQSMSRKGNCWDNAPTESFFHTLKTEEVYRRRYATREEAKCAIRRYILMFYNAIRLHSSLGYQSPNAYARQLLQASVGNSVPDAQPMPHEGEPMT